MITASDIQVIKDVTDNVPVTHEILETFGFKRYIDNYSFTKHIQYKKDNITLFEYSAKTNAAIIKPYESCYSGSLHIYNRTLDYVIYTIKQLKIFLKCHEELQQLKLQTEREIDKIGLQLKSTLLKRDNE